MSAILPHHGINSRRRRHSPMVLSRNNWLSFSHALTTAFWVRQLRRNFDSGRPSAAGHPTRRKQRDLTLSPDYLAAIWLSGSTNWTFSRCTAGNISCFWPRVMERRPAALQRPAEWRTSWAHVQIIFKHCFHDEIRPGVIMWFWFCVNFVRLSWTTAERHLR